MNISISMVPRTVDMNEVSWLFKTRKYIPRYNLYETYKSIYGSAPNGIPTAEELAEAFKEHKNRDARITVKIVSHNFDEACIEKYLDKELTRDFGIALAIEFRKLEKIINIAKDSDIFLYLTEYSLNDAELSVIVKRNIMKELSQRIIDKSKVMYTILNDNFAKLLKNDDCGVIDENFISGYIEHASFYNGNPLLKYILEKHLDSHPIFENLYCLAWNPFTKSRCYSHWLNVSKRMNELSKYYQDIKSDSENIKANNKYIANYIKFKSIYDEDI